MLSPSIKQSLKDKNSTPFGKAGPPCKICGAASAPFGSCDLSKFCSNTNPLSQGFSGVPIYYYKCLSCEFIFTDSLDDWSPEDFSAYIYNEQYINFDPEYIEIRPRYLAERMANLLKGFEALRILDYGSGMGVFEKEMKLRGFNDVHSFDPFSNPVRPHGVFDLVTAFEVVEHSPQPNPTFEEMFSYLSENGILFIGTALLPPNISEMGVGWWYIAPRNGHVSIFSRASMQAIAKRAGRNIRFGGGLVSFEPKKLGLLPEMLEKLGPKVISLELLAPGSASAEWHGRERDFQWSKTAQLNWSFDDIPAGLIEIKIPIVHQITRDYTDGLKLTLNGSNLDLHRASHGLVGSFTLPRSGRLEVRLDLPMPQQPSVLSGSDDSRHLGIAVKVSGL